MTDSDLLALKSSMLRWKALTVLSLCLQPIFWFITSSGLSFAPATLSAQTKPNTAPAANSSKVVKCEQLVIVNKAGEGVALFGLDDKGEPTLLIERRGEYARHVILTAGGLRAEDSSHTSSFSQMGLYSYTNDNRAAASVSPAHISCNLGPSAFNWLTGSLLLSSPTGKLSLRPSGLSVSRMTAAHHELSKASAANYEREMKAKLAKREDLLVEINKEQERIDREMESTVFKCVDLSSDETGGSVDVYNAGGKRVATLQASKTNQGFLGLGNFDGVLKKAYTTE